MQKLPTYCYFLISLFMSGVEPTQKAERKRSQNDETEVNNSNDLAQG